MPKHPAADKTRSVRAPLFGAGAVVRFLGCVACDKRLTPLETRVLLFVTSFADFETGASFPAISTLAAALGSPRTSVQRALRKLERRGYLFVERRRHPNGGHTSNRYIPNLALANADGRVWLPISAEGWDVSENPSAMPRVVEATPAATKGGSAGHAQAEAQRVQGLDHNKGDDRSAPKPGPVTAERTLQARRLAQAQEIWLGKQDALQAALEEMKYRTWFGNNVEALAVESGRLILKAPTRFWAQKLEEEYLEIIESVVAMPVTIIH